MHLCLCLWSFAKTGTMGTLASQPEIGVRVRAQGHFRRPGVLPSEKLWDCLCKIMQFSALLAFLNTLTLFPCVPTAFQQWEWHFPLKWPLVYVQIQLSDYCRTAITGFFQSIALSSSINSLQDTLRLLTLWFEFGHWKDVNDVLIEGIRTVQIDNWLQVRIPVSILIRIPDCLYSVIIFVLIHQSLFWLCMSFFSIQYFVCCFCCETGYCNERIRGTVR